MPELPEVETTCRGISPLLNHRLIKSIHVYQPKLRLLVSESIAENCQNQTIQEVSRRGKYIVLGLNQGAILIHLGMTGHLQIIPALTERKKHDHIDLVLDNNLVLRYHDPRRFGSWQWLDGPPDQHPSIANLGLEPLSNDFNGHYLMQSCQNKKQPIKSTIMDNRIVVGVGNIYASESLFLSGIHPLMPAGSLSLDQYQNLVYQIKAVLKKAISAGGTTLKDFINPEGKPGYFSQSLYVYGRKNNACTLCEDTIQSITIGGRSTAFCPSCQPA